MTTVEIHSKAEPNNLLGVVVDPVLYARHFAGHDLRYQDDRDRHNDSGYSTRPGESSQGPSPSLSGKRVFVFCFCSIRFLDSCRLTTELSCGKTGPAESTEGDTTTSPRPTRRSEHFQSHFARDLAQTLPMTNTISNGYQNGNGVVAYPRVRFAVPEREAHFPPGTISSSSLV